MISNIRKSKSYSKNITTKEISCNHRKLPHRTKRMGEDNKTKRIAQVLFQARIDASNGLQQQGVNQDKFKNNN